MAFTCRKSLNLPKAQLAGWLRIERRGNDFHYPNE
jgi:hypothetical protein